MPQQEQLVPFPTEMRPETWPLLVKLINCRFGYPDDPSYEERFNNFKYVSYNRRGASDALKKCLQMDQDALKKFYEWYRSKVISRLEAWEPNIILMDSIRELAPTVKELEEEMKDVPAADTILLGLGTALKGSLLGALYQFWLKDLTMEWYEMCKSQESKWLEKNKDCKPKFRKDDILKINSQEFIVFGFDDHKKKYQLMYNRGKLVSPLHVSMRMELVDGKAERVSAWRS